MTEHKSEWTLDAFRVALEYIPNDDRDLWLKIGMGLKDEFGDSAYDIWFDWSSSYEKFITKTARDVWKSISYSGTVGIGSVIHHAQEHGWSPKKSDSKKITPIEYAKKQAEREIRISEDAEKDMERMAAASERATELWNKATELLDHPYLHRKNINPYGVRTLPHWDRTVVDESSGEVINVRVYGVLVIPIYSTPKSISSLQVIFQEFNEILGRDKDFLPGGKKQGCYFKIGDLKKDTRQVIICEGFATGASIHEATGIPVMVAFDAGNLKHVAIMVRSKYPEPVQIIIAGDNDLYGVKNTGAIKANEAAWEIKGLLAIPEFMEFTNEPSDFNDIKNLEEINRQIRVARFPDDPAFFLPPNTKRQRRLRS